MSRKIYFVVMIFLSLIVNVVYADVSTLTAKDPSLIKQLYMPNGNVVMGNPKGKLTLVEFFAFDCHNCRDFYPQLQNIIAAHPNLRVVYKEYQIFGRLSQLPDNAALAAARQGKYAEMHDAMMNADRPLTRNEIFSIAKQQNLNMDQFNKDINDPVLQSYVKQNIRLATQLGLEGIPKIIVAPTAIISNPTKYTQYVASADTKSVNEAIKKAQHEAA